LPEKAAVARPVPLSGGYSSRDLNLKGWFPFP
jgi:hypothetical protein